MGAYKYISELWRKKQSDGMYIKYNILDNYVKNILNSFMLQGCS